MTQLACHGLRIPQRALRRWAAFTLVEMLMVVAIIGIIAAVGLPPIVTSLRKGPIRQAMSDLVEGCRHARMAAIMSGAPADLVIRAESGVLSVAPARGGLGSSGGPGADGRPSGRTSVSIALAFKGQIPETVAFRELSVNRRDMMEFDEARVRFYPNGTCDEFRASILSELGEERTIWLEISTGRENVEVIR